MRRILFMVGTVFLIGCGRQEPASRAVVDDAKFKTLEDRVTDLEKQIDTLIKDNSRDRQTQEELVRLAKKVELFRLTFRDYLVRKQVDEVSNFDIVPHELFPKSDQ